MDEKLLYSAKDLKAVTGFSLPTVYKMMHDPEMPVLRVGGRLYMHRERFQEWLKNHSAPLEEGDKMKTLTTP